MINWIPVSEKKPTGLGWYIAAVLPRNHSGSYEDQKTDLNADNGWRKSFGFTKVWYNTGDFYEPSHHGQRSVRVTELVTHWAEVPDVPILTESHQYEKHWNAYRRKSADEIFRSLTADSDVSEDFKQGFLKCLSMFGIS